MQKISLKFWSWGSGGRIRSPVSEAISSSLVLYCCGDSSLNKVNVLLHWSYTDAPPSAHCHGTKNGNASLRPLACLLTLCSSRALAMPVQICGSKQEVTVVSEQPWLPPHPAQAFFLLLCWQSGLTPRMWLPHHPLPTTGFWSCTTEAADCMGKFVTLRGESPSKHFPFSPSPLNLSPQHKCTHPLEARLWCWKLFLCPVFSRELHSKHVKRLSP